MPTPLGAHLKVVLCRAHRNRHTVQLGDVPRAFLHAPMDEVLTVTPPKEWEQLLKDHGIPVLENEKWTLTKATYCLRQSPALWDTFFADAQKKLEKLKLKRLLSDSSAWCDERKDLTVVKYVDDLLACRSESVLKEHYQELQMYLLMELHEPLRSGDTQMLLGREPTLTERGFAVKLSEALLHSIATLAGTDGGKSIKLPGSHTTHPMEGDEATGRLLASASLWPWKALTSRSP